MKGFTASVSCWAVFGAWFGLDLYLHGAAPLESAGIGLAVALLGWGIGSLWLGRDEPTHHPAAGMARWVTSILLAAGAALVFLPVEWWIRADPGDGTLRILGRWLIHPLFLFLVVQTAPRRLHLPRLPGKARS